MTKSILAALIALPLSIFASSPAATQAWVKNYHDTHTSSSGGSSSTVVARAEKTPATISTNITGTATMTDGTNSYTVTMSSALHSSTNLAIKVRASTVSGVTNGTTFVWNAALGTFDTVQSAALSTIRYSRKFNISLSTNVMGKVSYVTNYYDTYSATINATNYNSTVYGGNTYLVSPLGIRGQKIEIYISYCSDAEANAARGVAVAYARPFTLFAAWADTTYTSPQSGMYGAVEIGTITYETGGRTRQFVGSYTGAFSPDGYTSIYDFVADGIALARAGQVNLTSELNKLLGMVEDPRNWGLFTDGDIMTGTDGFNIKYETFKKTDFWQELVARAKQWLNDEAMRIIAANEENAAQHNCPYGGGCYCQFSWNDLSGNTQYCSKRETPQHVWQIFAVSASGGLNMTTPGCQICARCHEARESEGAIHIMVPDTDDFDYCGCYCKYYYMKKNTQEEEPLPSPIVDVEEIETDTRYEEKEVEVPTGEGEGTQTVVVEVPVTVTVATNRFSFGNAQMATPGWSYVEEVVKDPWGEDVTIQYSTPAKELGYDGEVELGMHCDPVSHPLQCTCKCGLHHTFKKSPCPEVCRGCNSHRNENEYSNVDLIRDSTNAEWHVSFRDGYWQDEEYDEWDDDVGEYVTKTYNNASSTISPYRSWYVGITNGYAACGCACGKRHNTASGGEGAWGDHRIFHCYAQKPVSEIKDPFTKAFLTSEGYTTWDYCSCNCHDWEVANPQPLITGWESTYNSSGSYTIPTCKGVCMWHYPSNHTTRAGSSLVAQHTGVMSGRMYDWAGFSKTALVQAYQTYYGTSLQCGCICQAITKDTANTYNIKWPDDVMNSLYHYTNVFDPDIANCSCLCECGLYHTKIDNEYLDKISTPTTDQSALVIKEADICPNVCALCGYYADNGTTNKIDRAPITSHDHRVGYCECKCARNPLGATMSFGKRGWSAAQDDFKYAHNTYDSERENSMDYDDAKDWHKCTFNGDYACVCDGCMYDSSNVFRPLLHKHASGDACKDVCKEARTGAAHVGEICGHCKAFFKKDEDGNIVDNIGDHVRTNALAAYCGCDCGRSAVVVNGVETLHFAPTNDCYCYGEFANNNYMQHVNGQMLLGHKGEVHDYVLETNKYTCAVCNLQVVIGIHTNWCETCGHGWLSSVNPHNCVNGCGMPGCQCNHSADGTINCDCPACLNWAENGVAGTCTCGAVEYKEPGYIAECNNIADGGYSNRYANSSVPVVFDGEEPVYSIGRYGMYHAFAYCGNLKEVRLGQCLSVGAHGLDGAFMGCAALTNADLSAIEYSAECDGQFKRTFYGCRALKTLHLEGLKNIGMGESNPFEDMCSYSAVEVLRFDSLTNIEGVETNPDNPLVSAGWSEPCFKEIWFNSADASNVLYRWLFIPHGYTTHVDVYVPQAAYSTWAAAWNGEYVTVHAITE